MTRHWLGGVGAGVAAGIISSLIIARYAAGEKRTEQRSGPESPAAPADPPKPTSAGSQNGLEQRIRMLEHQVADAEEEIDAPTPPVPERPPPAPASREAVEQAFAKKLTDQRAEPIDPNWAPRAARALEKDLQALVQPSEGQPAVKGKVVSVSCATSTCEAELEWDSWDTARSEWQQFMHASYELNCAREIVLPEPTAANRAAPYRGSMLYQCEQARIDETVAQN
jgi:hypothetical protein